MIPGLTISVNGSVSTMGMSTGVYINGQPADVEDIVYSKFRIIGILFNEFALVGIVIAVIISFFTK